MERIGETNLRTMSCNMELKQRGRHTTVQYNFFQIVGPVGHKIITEAEL